MTNYRRALLIAAVIISLPSAFLISVGIMRASPGTMLIWSGMLILWWGSYVFVRSEKRFSFWGSFLLINLFWWPLLAQTIRRIAFVFENGGMEPADGHGSPLAFLIGVAFEQAFFLPLTAALITGGLVIIKRSPGRATH